MKMIKYLFPLWIGVLLYTGLSFCFGAKGLSAMGQLESEKSRQNANITALTAINDDLTMARDAYNKDSSNYYVNARELGFAASQEHFIRIIGLAGAPKSMASPGQVISVQTPQFIPEQFIQIFSFFMAITLLVSMGAYDFLKSLKGRETKTAYYGPFSKLG